MAGLLVCATFPLIFVGGLVTTTDAGMAVPDWPTTYGYNLFLYPWQTWLAGPWDLFVEHGHRLLGAVVGLIAIALVAVFWRYERRRWLLACAVAALLAVIVQGVLGGVRVTQDSRTLAMGHGCFGPAFFALCVALTVCTSRWWRDAGSRGGGSNTANLFRLALVTTVFAYLQLVVGAQLRHGDETGGPGDFHFFVLLHLLLAALLCLQAGLVGVRAWRSNRRERGLLQPARGLAGLVLVQVCLGAGTWVLKYGWPGWFSQPSWAQAHVNVNESFSQVLCTTAHVALGSLILAQALLIALRAGRCGTAGRSALHQTSSPIGAAA
jgi:cytochrome c oxidase assembly protein subunit 15